MTKLTSDLETFRSTLAAWLDHVRERDHEREGTPTPLELAREVLVFMDDLLGGLSNEELEVLSGHFKEGAKPPERQTYALHPHALIEIAVLSDLEDAWDMGAKRILLRRDPDKWVAQIQADCGFTCNGVSDEEHGPHNAVRDAVNALEQHQHPHDRPYYDA